MVLVDISVLVAYLKWDGFIRNNSAVMEKKFNLFYGWTSKQLATAVLPSQKVTYIYIRDYVHVYVHN